MIDAASSILGNRMELQRDSMSMSIMKRMQAEQAMAQMLMDSAKSVEQITSSSSGTQGSIVDVYA